MEQPVHSTQPVRRWRVDIAPGFPSTSTPNSTWTSTEFWTGLDSWVSGGDATRLYVGTTQLYAGASTNYLHITKWHHLLQLGNGWGLLGFRSNYVCGSVAKWQPVGFWQFNAKLASNLFVWLVRSIHQFSTEK